MPKGKLRDCYAKGKIYKLTGSTNPKTIYIGSTCKSLERRLWHHNNCHNDPTQRQSSAAQMYQQNQSVSIELIEDVSCNIKEELTDRERFWIESYREQGYNVTNYQTPVGLLTKEELRDRCNKARNEQNNRNMYQCPCGSLVQNKRKENHLATRLHAKRISFSSQPPAMDVNANAFSSPKPTSSSTSPETLPDHHTISLV